MSEIEPVWVDWINRSVLPQRFWEKVEVAELGAQNVGGGRYCLVWTGSKRRGYGRLWWNGKSSSAHIVAYQELVGEIPAGHLLDHWCHDPLVCSGSETCPHRACLVHTTPVTLLHNSSSLRSSRWSVSPKECSPV